MTEARGQRYQIKKWYTVILLLKSIQKRFSSKIDEVNKLFNVNKFLL